MFNCLFVQFPMSAGDVFLRVLVLSHKTDLQMIPDIVRIQSSKSIISRNVEPCINKKVICLLSDNTA